MSYNFSDKQYYAIAENRVVVWRQDISYFHHDIVTYQPMGANVRTQYYTLEAPTFTMAGYTGTMTPDMDPNWVLLPEIPEIGSNRFLSLEDIINNYIVLYGDEENNHGGKAMRRKVEAFAQRALQELSYDTLRVKSLEVELRDIARILLPKDYVEVVALNWVNRFGVEQWLVPRKDSGNPRSPLQDFMDTGIPDWSPDQRYSRLIPPTEQTTTTEEDSYTVNFVQVATDGVETNTIRVNADLASIRPVTSYPVGTRWGSVQSAGFVVPRPANLPDNVVQFNVNAILDPLSTGMTTTNDARGRNPGLQADDVQPAMENGDILLITPQAIVADLTAAPGTVGSAGYETLAGQGANGLQGRVIGIAAGPTNPIATVEFPTGTDITNLFDIGTTAAIFKNREVEARQGGLSYTFISGPRFDNGLTNFANGDTVALTHNGVMNTITFTEDAVQTTDPSNIQRFNFRTTDVFNLDAGDLLTFTSMGTPLVDQITLASVGDAELPAVGSRLTLPGTEDISHNYGVEEVQVAVTDIETNTITLDNDLFVNGLSIAPQTYPAGTRQGRWLTDDALNPGTGNQIAGTYIQTQEEQVRRRAGAMGAAAPNPVYSPQVGDTLLFFPEGATGQTLTTTMGALAGASGSEGFELLSAQPIGTTPGNWIQRTVTAVGTTPPDREGNVRTLLTLNMDFPRDSTGDIPDAFLFRGSAVQVTREGGINYTSTSGPSHDAGGITFTDGQEVTFTDATGVEQTLTFVGAATATGFHTVRATTFLGFAGDTLTYMINGQNHQEEQITLSRQGTAPAPEVGQILTVSGSAVQATISSVTPNGNNFDVRVNRPQSVFNPTQGGTVVRTIAGREAQTRTVASSMANADNNALHDIRLDSVFNPQPSAGETVNLVTTVIVAGRPGQPSDTPMRVIRDGNVYDLIADTATTGQFIISEWLLLGAQGQYLYDTDGKLQFADDTSVTKERWDANSPNRANGSADFGQYATTTGGYYTYGKRYYLDTETVTRAPSYYVNDELGVIDLDPIVLNAANGSIISNPGLSQELIRPNVITMRYISDGLSGDPSEVQVHKFAEEALYDAIYYGMIAHNSRIPMNEKQRAQRKAYASRRTAKLRLSNLTPREIKQTLRSQARWIKT